MKKIACILLLCLLTGCAPQNVGKTTVDLFFVSADGGEIAAEPRALDANLGDALAETVVKELLKGPRTTENIRIIPEDTTLLSLKIVGTVAEVNLSASFDVGEDSDRLLRRYTMIYTVCALPDVQKAKILVEGNMITSLTTGEPLGALGTEDLAVSAPTGDGKTVVTLYFADENAMYLKPESRQVVQKEGESLEKIIVEELIKGPTSTNLYATVSGDVKVLSADTQEGVCFVNLSAAYVSANTGGTAKETIALYSVVNTLCALDNVEKVHFLIEGETRESFGQMEFNNIFVENTALYEKE